MAVAPLPLVCPACAAAHPEDERFCRDCGTPLVQGSPRRCGS